MVVVGMVFVVVSVLVKVRLVSNVGVTLLSVVVEVKGDVIARCVSEGEKVV